MFRVIIADDEQYEREYLKKTVENNYAGVLEVAYMAENGADVIEKLEDYGPQIVILDIKMPKLDGLETASYILGNHPDTQIIIVSAYDEFSYARTAMKLGVRDFLVKPYLDSELKETLDKVLATLGGFTENAGKSDDPAGLRFIDDIDKDIVWDIAFARKSTRAIKRELMLWGVEDYSYKCISIYYEGFDRLMNRGISIIKGMFSPGNSHVILSYMLNHMIVFVFSDGTAEFTELGASIRKVRAFLQDVGQSPAYCGVSGIYSDPENFRDSFEEASRYILDYADGTLERAFNKTLDICKDICDCEDKACFAIASGNYEQAEKWLIFISDALKKGLGDNYSNRLLLRHILIIARKLNKQHDLRVTTEKMLLIEETFDSDMSEEKDLVDLIGQSIDLLMNAASSASIPNRNTVLIRRAKEYIEANYKQPISLQTVADELSVSNGYLSKCFSSTENCGFSEYIIGIRLAKAKELMKEGEMTIQEIAYEVGFSDPNYFGKCFKKHENMSPKDYCTMYMS